MIYNEIADSGQLSQVLQRRLNMLGAAPAPSLMPEIAPTLTLENDRPEWGWLKGEIRKSARIFQGAAAGVYSMAQLYIATNRRNVAVITRIVSHATTLVDITRAGIGGGFAGWTAVNAPGRDLRDQSNGGAVFVERTTNAALPAGETSMGALLSSAQEWQEPIVLAPSGAALFIRTNAVNQGLSLTVCWYERQALPGELG